MNDKDPSMTEDRSDCAVRLPTELARPSMDAKQVHAGADDAEKGPDLSSTAAHGGPIGNIVDWNGPNDPQYPMNWSKTRKFKNISVICYCTFLT